MIEWKNSDERKPLIVLGARQVGKTYSLLDFGKQHYKYVAYINCDENEQAKNLFVQDYNMRGFFLPLLPLRVCQLCPVIR